MNNKSRLISPSNIRAGKPVKRGTRSSVELMLKKLTQGMNVKEIMEAYPKLSKENIMDTLAYTDDVRTREKVIVFLTP